jgi:hypothetical protein
LCGKARKVVQAFHGKSRKAKKKGIRHFMVNLGKQKKKGIKMPPRRIGLRTFSLQD